MFARLTRLPLRRSLHTSANAAQNSFRLGHVSRVALGASAAAAAYMTWNLTSEGNRIHLDNVTSPTGTKLAKKPAPSSTSPPPTPETQPTPTEFLEPTSSLEPSEPSAETPKEPTEGDGASGSSGGGGGGGAYNPETGEINWDCPCLGGMAHGPCGEQFKEAFSCFIFSEDEPKGINCVDAFKRMQDCFREHPEHYADEIMDDDDDDDDVKPISASGEPAGASAEDLTEIPEGATTSAPVPTAQPTEPDSSTPVPE
ncbi:hypothetical protein FA15DRAFT_624891 [Coprinopsis marcescibilis]|uniref:Mitochondrial intermembrane space import and assembly protein 40 n=1 Tax=Coprinopsis marcescibilis TaxID=230819 RepID=A0A5C3KKN5_COPMA|nr:hypothetical protein FA15DRAFT_624891 [Coprinopsis marcescibilis]